MKNKSNLSFDYNEEDFKNVNEIDTLEVIKKLLRNKVLIISITGLSLMISVIHALSLKRIWQGDFQIVLSGEKSMGMGSDFLMGEINMILPPSLTQDSKDDLKTQVEILRSPSILFSVFEKIKEKKKDTKDDMSNYPYSKWLKDNLDIILLKGTTVLNLSYRDTNKDLILPVLNDISKKYQNYSNRDFKRSIENGIKYLENQIFEYRLKRKTSRVNAKNYSIANNLGFLLDSEATDVLDKEMNNNYETFNNLDPELIRLKTENYILELTTKLERINKIDNSSRQIFYMAQNIPRFASSGMFLDIVDLDKKISIMRSNFQETDISIQNALRERELSLAILKDEIKNYLQTELEIANAKKITNERPAEVIINYKILLEEMKRDALTLTELENKKRALSLEKAKAKDPWELITNPTLLDRPVGPKRRQIALQGLFLGFILSSLVAIFKEEKSNLTYSSKNISRLLNKKQLYSFHNENENNWIDIIKILLKNPIFENTKGKIFLVPIGEINKNKLTKLNNKFNEVIENQKVFITKDLSEVKSDDCQILIASYGVTTINQLKNIKKQLDLQSGLVIGWLSL